MKAKEAHEATVAALLKRELTQKVLLDVETMAAQGKFSTTLETDFDIDVCQDLEKVLRDLGYDTTLVASYGGKKIHIRW